MPEHVLMCETEIIADGGRRCRWSATEKLRIVEETWEGGASISVVARRNGVAPNLLYRWRRPMPDGGAVAICGDDDVTSNRAVRQMEERTRVGAATGAQGPRGRDIQGNAEQVALETKVLRPEGQRLLRKSEQGP